jgi:SWI/SNF-related matrix-associated actin-dependent regulator 1 of chromatin subfamily A
MNALRQVAAQEKMEDTIAWIEQWLEDSGQEKTIIFGIHRDINELLAQHFNAPLIYGGMTGAERHEAEEQFQNEPQTRVLVCSIDAAGVGLTLTAATNVMFVELPWRPMDFDQAIGRAYGRLSDVHGVTAYQIIVPNTIEDEICSIIAKKRDIIEKGADGSKSVASQILNKIMKRLT